MAKNDNFQDGDIKIRIWDGTTEAEVDGLMGYLVGMDIVHHKAHEGNLYSMWNSDADVDISGPKIYRFNTGASQCHWIGAVTVNDGFLAELWKGCELTTSGTLLTGFENHYDGHANTPTATWYEDATFSGGYVKAANRVFGTGVPSQRIGGEARSGVEHILTPNTDYYIKFTMDADDSTLFFNSTWYEKDIS